ncbi:MAG: hypothetical protein A2087_08775 [Spirochaetes bacterium GWD1_61_31]|nr:MAG: hypothetical protein A2Y37_14460 [Spirochaetes bacterium GWB1_60_80]OHD32380.1 MAG: hypothetical protein A2004_06410 [Spirochaetes bacterium GWC1_61_12]OHD38061.1 MAG: hypothetical protein A2087_08775 [Spirochaetes bacterium GWD1_61_31]OHD44547.1 MAG: hypothetical protein A2Y35_05300 [Spirochaetes bacterium GWE1_60_18]OHD58665.1 MAG: hypothetical protein A2Y32_03315 [Spirochaetes bacterium GWF1_60_12]HAP43204.1 hypothetical protein [Spirochaetaceae bacterium]
MTPPPPVPPVQIPGAWPWPDFKFWQVASTTSTMDDARLQRAAGCRRGGVLADAQSAGRGRLPGRRWQAEPGASLLCTLWLPRAEFQAAPPSLLVGAAVRLALEQCLTGELGRLEIKWPNDLLVDGRKLAGLLCEAAGDTVFCGLGLNIEPVTVGAAAAAAFRRPPTSLRQAFGQAPERGRLLAALADSLAALCGGRLDWLEVVQAHLAWRGQTVEFRPGLGNGPAVRGRLDGVAVDGSLVLTTDAGWYCALSGELTLVGGLE